MQILSELGTYLTAELGGGIDSRVPGAPVAVTARGRPGEPNANGPWQQWQQIVNDDGTVSFTCVLGFYLTAELGGGSTLSTDRTENGPWQRFTKVGGFFRCYDGRHYLRVRTDLGTNTVDATGSAQGMTFRYVGHRAPLPPFPPGSYDRTLPWIPPAGRDFLRANAWGITLPGAPMVPGGSSKHPERILSWFLDRFPRDWQARWLQQNLDNAYTHAILSAPDSMIGFGQTPGQFVATCQRVKTAGLFVTVFLGSKVYQPRDMTPAQWIAYVDPILDTLLESNAADEFVPAWEWDLFNVPGGPTLEVCEHIGDKVHAASKSCWLHFSAEKTSWFADGDPRGRYGFWDDLGDSVDGLLYQTVPTWDIGTTQARLVDTLTQFGAQGHNHKLRFFEDQASLMFDGDTPTEDDADLRGYLGCCTAGPSKVWGFGNGARYPSGDAL